jgi:DNA gyrase/topoisomerase IV subunit B
MNKFINAKHLFIAQPPLYRIKTRQGVKWVYSEQEKDKTLKKSTPKRTNSSATKADETFQMLMGGEVPARKAFI